MATSGIRLWVVLWKAYDSLREHAHRNIASLGLGLSDFGVLEAVLHKGPLPVNTIGPMVGLTSGSISTAVDRLAAKGLVERHESEEDRRTRVVHLTNKGRKLIESAFAEHSRALDRATSGLTPDERAQAAELLKKLGKTAQSLL